MLSPSTSVAFVPGADTDYYINAAGGFTRSADKGRTFIQQANGLIEKKNEDPDPGAIVVVPEKDLTQQGPGFAVIIGAVAQTLTALTAILVLLNQINN